jgi:hypothetical protein
MAKIVILGYKPLHTNRSGYEKPLLASAKIFSDLGYEVQLLSFGNDNGHVLTRDGLKEYTIKQQYPEEGLSVLRLIDFLTLFLFGYKRSIMQLNNNVKMLEALSNENPDIIVHGDFILPHILAKYKSIHNSVKIISYSDEPKIILTSFNSIYSIPNTIRKFVPPVLLTRLKRKYVRYSSTLYNKTIAVSDAIITPTNLDKKAILRLIQHSKKIFVIPPVSVDKKDLKHPKKITSIKRVAFIGAYSFWPNREAINLIETKIAPLCPKQIFLIAGTGCPKLKHKNIQYVGYVPDIKKFFDTVDLCIAPIVTGTGMKNKIMDYFLYKKPTIGTSLAFEGYNVRNRENAIVEDDINLFYTHIYELNNDTKLLFHIQQAAHEPIKHLTETKIKSKWKIVLDYALR